ncbi:hypothetical protein GCM10010495_03120 [Kitasatospora herbaricolor]|uniref:hypothetical protein n=1 Tax=Kitasatospora herbaricolor TaxID=68217 RepID=UPI001749B05C|nr:hypothetical protein [Kitasatospora herbaricolor]MDQ0311785.1 hypothetical protein [Kitasatospora herbaricolor]GGU96415.1 hypothetical protein GCM10010495_03120 [Kitasatospora herbaricolor]
MAVIAVVGGPGAPGATTAALALLLAWPLEPGRKILLVECDPDGGAVLAGALEGRVEAVYGLRNLAVADRRGLLAQTLWDQLIDLSPEGTTERLLLPGLTDPTQAPGLAYTWEPLVETLHGLEQQGYDVLLDLGRSGATGPSAVLARRADVVVATLRTTLRGLSAARPRLAALREDLDNAGSGADALGLLLVAEGPYSASEVSREFGLPTLGLLPHAPRTARVLSDGGDSTDRRFIRSELMRTARSAADQIQLLTRSRRRRLAPGGSPAQAAAAPLAAGGAPEPAGPQAPPVPQVPHAQHVPYGQAAYARPVQDQPVQDRSADARPAQVRPPAAPVPPGQGLPVPGGLPVEHQPPRGSWQSGPTGHPLAYPQQPGPPGYGTAPAYGAAPAHGTTSSYGTAPLAGLAPQPAAPAPFPGQQPPPQAHPQQTWAAPQSGAAQGYGGPQPSAPQSSGARPPGSQAYPQTGQPSWPQPAPGYWSQEPDGARPPQTPSTQTPSPLTPSAVTPSAAGGAGAGRVDRGGPADAGEPGTGSPDDPQTPQSQTPQIKYGQVLRAR